MYFQYTGGYVYQIDGRNSDKKFYAHISLINLNQKMYWNFKNIF